MVCKCNVYYGANCGCKTDTSEVFVKQNSHKVKINFAASAIKFHFIPNDVKIGWLFVNVSQY